MITDWREFLSKLAATAYRAFGERAKKYPPSSNPPAPEQTIQSIGRHIKGELPDDYKAFLRASDGFTNYLPRSDVMSCADLLSTFEQARAFGSYETWLIKTLLFDDEIGFGVQPSQVLLVVQWGGSPSAIFLVVDTASPHYGVVIDYAPNQKRRIETWSAYWKESLQSFQEKAGESVARLH